MYINIQASNSVTQVKKLLDERAQLRGHFRVFSPSHLTERVTDVVPASPLSRVADRSLHHAWLDLRTQTRRVRGRVEHVGGDNDGEWVLLYLELVCIGVLVFSFPLEPCAKETTRSSVTEFQGFILFSRLIKLNIHKLKLPTRS